MEEDSATVVKSEAGGLSKAEVVDGANLPAAATETAADTAGAKDLQINYEATAVDQKLGDGFDVKEVEDAGQSEAVKAVIAPIPTPATTELVEPTSRDVVLGPASTGLVMNELLHDMIGLESVLWHMNERPVPDGVNEDVLAVCQKLMNVIQKGKPLELAGLKDVPRPFLRSQGRFLVEAGDGSGFCVSEDEKVQEALCGYFLDELGKGAANIDFGQAPYKVLRDMLDRAQKDSPHNEGGKTPSTAPIVLVPDPKDAILLRRGASNADKLYESHVGNKVVFSLISQVVTTFTTSSDARLEAALNLLQGLQDAASATPSGSAGAEAQPAAVEAGQNRRARFLLRNIREDESVFWSVLDPSDAALFAICFVFEVFLEKEIHLQLPQQPTIVLKDTEPALMEHSTTTPVENPTDYDVLFGRGGMTNAHPGNRRFRDVIALHRPDYIRALKMDKPGVARKIVKAIRRSGRFMKKNSQDGKWYDVGDRTAAEKTSQGLRERSNAEKRQRSALREALRIRRQDMSEEGDNKDEAAESAEKGDKTEPEESAKKKQKTEHESTPAGVSVLNYMGPNLGIPLSLGMKEAPAPSPALVKRQQHKQGTNNGGSMEIFTEGLPPNAVDEDGNILVTDYDILCGRGGLTNHHKGNKRFRDVVALHRPDYVRAPKIQKPSVARVIVRAIRNGDPPGRFLRKDEKTGRWVDIGDKKAAEKTSQALREKTNEERDKLRRDIAALGPSANVLLPNPSSYLNSATVAAFSMAGIVPDKDTPAVPAGSEKEPAVDDNVNKEQVGEQDRKTDESDEKHSAKEAPAEASGNADPKDDGHDNAQLENAGNAGTASREEVKGGSHVTEVTEEDVPMVLDAKSTVDAIAALVVGAAGEETAVEHPLTSEEEAVVREDAVTAAAPLQVVGTDGANTAIAEKTTTHGQDTATEIGEAGHSGDASGKGQESEPPSIPLVVKQTHVENTTTEETRADRTDLSQPEVEGEAVPDEGKNYATPGVAGEDERSTEVNADAHEGGGVAMERTVDDVKDSIITEALEAFDI